MLFIFAFSVNGYAKKGDTKIYKNVYNYMVANELAEKLPVGISDEIVFMEFSSFAGKSDLKIIDSLVILDNRIQFESYTIRDLRKKIKGRKSDYSLIYFSKPYKEYLILELIQSKKKVTGKYRVDSMFGSTKRYLFKVIKNKVTKICEIEIANN